MRGDMEDDKVGVMSWSSRQPDSSSREISERCDCDVAVSCQHGPCADRALDPPCSSPHVGPHCVDAFHMESAF